jgi:hypothetical protein
MVVVLVGMGAVVGHHRRLGGWAHLHCHPPGVVLANVTLQKDPHHTLFLFILLRSALNYANLLVKLSGYQAMEVMEQY